MNDSSNDLKKRTNALRSAVAAHAALELARAKHNEAMAQRVKAFERAVAAGVLQKDIADAIGISPARVGQIILGGIR